MAAWLPLAPFACWAVIRVAGWDRGGVLVAGDFNATPDHSELRRLMRTGYRNAADVAGKGFGMTCPADRGYPPVIAIDHVLADERFSVKAVSVHRIAGSDHRAVLAHLRVSGPPGGPA